MEPIFASCRRLTRVGSAFEQTLTVLERFEVAWPRDVADIPIRAKIDELGSNLSRARAEMIRISVDADPATGIGYSV
jgi:hypothetical protein